ncbi:hypothetical protein SCUCBS95973_005376 [Sporothrix curviconia]|uniref:LPXTG-domain-containing protein n=1 Tax=Sporothrix curviconia TaxID=1260050 RepID=A0ABP0BWQ8_9PEZI
MARLHKSGLQATALAVFFFLFRFIATAQAIQVTPNSPCASLCIDNSSLDVSDPNSSTTTNADMSCDDSDFVSSAAGQKWTACMGCLQNSTFAQGVESDQAWFFYNLRYNVDYCVFGYPNSSDIIGSNPCQTSTACGPLQLALYDGIPSGSSNQTEYGYCSANGTTLTSSVFKGCIACVAGGGSQNIVANSLTALEAGCLQQLPPSEAVGLSGSVFASATTIAIVAPTESSGSGSGSSGSGSSTHRVATTTIAVIIVVALLVVAAVGGFAFVCYRKRRGSARLAAGGPKSIFRKDDGLASAESGIGSGGGGSGGGGFVPSGGIRGSALGGITSSSSSPIVARNSPASATSTGPTVWSARFPSSDHISSPLSFQCRASATSLDEMVDLRAVGEANTVPRVSATPAVPAVPQGGEKGHSRNNSGASLGELGTPLQEQLLQQQVPAASRKKYQKPQAISSAAISAQIEAVIAKNSSTSTPPNGGSGGSNAAGLGVGGVGGSTSTSHLPAIVESPFPSPAPVASVADSIGLRIHSSDFDKKEYVEAAVNLQQRQRQQTSPPRLQKLTTSFSPLMGSGGSNKSNSNTPTSTTALLSSSSLQQHHHQQQQQQQSTTPVYNPAAYSPASYHPGSLYAQSQRGSIGYQSSYHGVHHTNNSSAPNSPLREQQQQQAPTSASSYTASGPSPTVAHMAAANLAVAANKRGVYQGWSAMISAAQQYQQQQLQQQKQQGSSSLPASAVGSYRERERDPVSAVSAVSVASMASFASAASVASSNGLGAATMAARQSYSAGPGGDVSSATSLNAPGSAFSPSRGSAAAVRPAKTKPPHGHGKSRASMASRSPHSTRSPQHTQSELVRIDFAPPPPVVSRR